MAGTVEWWIADGPWGARLPGSFVHLPSRVPHAMRTGPEPMLALYAWLGDLTTSARLTDGASGGPSETPPKF